MQVVISTSLAPPLSLWACIALKGLTAWACHITVMPCLLGLKTVVSGSGAIVELRHVNQTSEGFREGMTP